MPISENKTTIAAKKKKGKEQNEKNLGQPTLPLYTLLRVYNITTKCWQIFFANFWQFHFCQLISTTWTFFPNPKIFGFSSILSLPIKCHLAMSEKR